MCYQRKAFVILVIVLSIVFVSMCVCVCMYVCMCVRLNTWVVTFLCPFTNPRYLNGIILIEGEKRGEKIKEKLRFQ